MDKEIDLNKQYIFPEQFKEIRHNGKIIIIFPNYANWIVLESDEQFDFFKRLSQDSIKNAIDYCNCTEEDIIKVITQIEARHLESSAVTKQNYDHMQLYLTNNCNMRCPHCYMYAGKAFEDELSTEEIIELLSNFRRTGGVRLILTGGEIGTRPDLKHILIFAHKIGLEIELLTNGTLFSHSFIDEISPLISRVQISIDGYSEESNSKIRGVNNFSKALNTVDQFIKNNIKTEVAITPYPSSTLHEKQSNYVAFARSLIAKYNNKILVKFTADIFEGRNIHNDSLDIDSYRHTMNNIIAEVYGMEDSTNGFVLAARNQCINDNCAYGALNISAKGDVFPCAKLFTADKFCNIRLTTWDKIIEYCNLLKTKSNIDNLKPCCNCELKYICGGGCRLEHFNLFKKPIELIQHEYYEERDMCEERIQILDLLIATNELIYH